MDAGADCWDTGCEWSGQGEGLVQTEKRVQGGASGRAHQKARSSAILLSTLVLASSDRVDTQPAAALLAYTGKSVEERKDCGGWIRPAYRLGWCRKIGEIYDWLP